MAMQKKFWSINGLANELGMDRRTMAKRLEGLPPATVKKAGSRTEKRWRLADVIRHLNTPASIQKEDKFIEEIKYMVGHKMYPALVSSRGFMNLLTNLAVEELGLTKIQAMRVFQFATLSLCWGLAEIHEDDDMVFAHPDHIMEMYKMDLDEWVAQNWPD